MYWTETLNDSPSDKYDNLQQGFNILLVMTFSNILMKLSWKIRDQKHHLKRVGRIKVVLHN